MIDYQHQHQHPNQHPQSPPHPYAHPQQQHPHHPHPYAYPPQYPTPQPAVPEAIGDERRMLAAAVDGVITVVAGLGLALQLADDKSVGVFWAYVAGCAFGVSFVHHVLGAVVFRTTVGKFLLVSRVVRDADGGRPRFWQAVCRWLLGLTWLPMQPIRSLIGAEGDPYEDGCGLRYVRSRDLR
ncbi:RDD family protein [Streptomyces rectiverticillatus]|uniref:RDD family protein n=1 Tax=Streptomyces rectiverticillatus TaxID=173860 RepID=UPI0015C32A4C|nr:RDD family protein [Streptomyces rectiverticillatus]